MQTDAQEAKLYIGMRPGTKNGSYKSLYEIGLRSGLCTLLGGKKTQNGVTDASVMGAAIRAILGAVWQDCEDLSILRRIFEKLQRKDWPKANGNFLYLMIANSSIRCEYAISFSRRNQEVE